MVHNKLTKSGRGKIFYQQKYYLKKRKKKISKPEGGENKIIKPVSVWQNTVKSKTNNQASKQASKKNKQQTVWLLPPYESRDHEE